MLDVCMDFMSGFVNAREDNFYMDGIYSTIFYMKFTLSGFSFYIIVRNMLYLCD